MRYTTVKKRLLSYIIVCSILLTLFPCNVAYAYGNSSYSSRTPKAYAFLREYTKSNGTYDETLQTYTMRVRLQQGTWYELIFDAGDDNVAMVICQYTNSQDEYHKLGTLELPYEYWNYEDGWIDMTTIVGGYYMAESDDADGSAIGDYAVLPRTFSGTNGFFFNKGYSGHAESKQNHEKDAALFVNDILTLLDAILRKGGYTVQDLGFVSYYGHTTHRYWGCHESLAPTCEQTGYEKDICYICGARLDQTVPALGHAWQLKETVSEGIDDEHGTGKYACSRCGKEKTAPLCALEVFTDAPAEGSWAHNAVDWAFFHGVTTGTSDTQFSPEKGCTRGQVVTFLWRAAGEPEPEQPDAGFTDLKPGAFYEKAVAWAVENGITKGTSEDKFSPDATCTRGQIVTFLWRFKGSPAPKSTETPFEDLKPGAYYGDSVAWAVENNVTNGMSDISFAPDNTCTRA